MPKAVDYSKLSPREKYLYHHGDALPGLLTDFGWWHIYGEDPNPDFGGPHHSPFLGTIEGTLNEVIDTAVGMKGFWQWGAGGHIEKADIVVAKRIRPQPVDGPKTEYVPQVPKEYEPRTIKMIELLEQRKQIEQLLLDVEKELEDEELRSRPKGLDLG